MSRTRFQLATLPEVQGDLKLDDAQKKLATDLLAKYRERLQSLGNDFQAIRDALPKINKELEGEFVAKLNDGQKSRINGLLAQVNGATALLDADIAKVVGINEDLAEKLRAVNEKNAAARREAFQGLTNATQEEQTAAFEKMTNEANRALLAELSDEQKKKFEELKGAVLTIDLTPLRPRRQN